MLHHRLANIPFGNKKTSFIRKRNPEVSPSQPTRSSRSEGRNFLESNYELVFPLSTCQNLIGSWRCVSCFFAHIPLCRSPINRNTCILQFIGHRVLLRSVASFNRQPEIGNSQFLFPPFRGRKTSSGRYHAAAHSELLDWG